MSSSLDAYGGAWSDEWRQRNANLDSVYGGKKWYFYRLLIEGLMILASLILITVVMLPDVLVAQQIAGFAAPVLLACIVATNLLDSEWADDNRSGSNWGSVAVMLLGVVWGGYNVHHVKKKVEGFMGGCGNY